MDWENKHFHQDHTFQAPREAVVEAMRRFAELSLPDWTTNPTADGFEAHGRSGFHHAVAQFHAAQQQDRTHVSVELSVRRADGMGYMLFDVGGYYDSQIGKWLRAIWEQLGLLYEANPWPAGHTPQPPYAGTSPVATVGARVVVADAQGKVHVGDVRTIAPQRLLVAFDEGGERWVPAASAHVVERR